MTPEPKEKLIAQATMAKDKAFAAFAWRWKKCHNMEELLQWQDGL